MSSNGSLLLGVDVGGTFTDAVAFGAGALHTAKVPTTTDDQAEGVIAAVEAVLMKAGAGAGEVEAFAHGMTVGTNALLERRGARTALVATRGFADVLEIARQRRPSLYHLCELPPQPVVGRELRFEIGERVGPQGAIETPTDAELDRLCDELAGAGVGAVAVCLLFSYAEPAHERLVAERIRERLPGVHVSASHEVLAKFREYERWQTTAIDAYLAPLLGDYLGRLIDRAATAGLPEPLVMRSSGGLATASEASRGGAWSVLSGPAGGAVGAALVARAAGEPDAVALDTGGTSCDVCLIEAGAVGRTDSREIDGLAIELPAVDVHTVGAGGGSVGWRDPGGALRVGPRSAGASPGPACYGRGGVEPTVTDANLVLGYLAARSPLSGIELDPEAARAACERLGRELGLGALEVAEGIVRIANLEMERALRVVTVERGVDPRGLVLVAFGGAGPMHAVALAGSLGMRGVLAPPAAGVLSALGLAAGERRRDAARTVMLRGPELTADALGDALARALEELGGAPAGSRVERALDVRYRGQSFELTVGCDERPDPASVAAHFAAEHERRYGYADGEASIEVVNVRVATASDGADLEGVGEPAAAADEELERSVRRARFAGEWHEAAVFGGTPPAGFEVAGPAVLEPGEATLVVPPGWLARAGEHGIVRVDRLGAGNAPTTPRAR